MELLVKSFFLSFGVFGRMILPMIAISAVSGIVWGMLSAVTGGYASILSGPITAAFTSLFGIRAALSLMGDHRRPGYQILTLYSILFGIFFIIAKNVAIVIPDFVTAIYTHWKYGEAISLTSFVNTDKLLMSAIGYQELTLQAVVSFVIYVAICVIMVVPLASVARSAGRGAKSAGFFDGAGRSFIPLFCIFSVSIFFQFFFGLLSVLMVSLPIALALLSMLITQSLPDLDHIRILQGLAVSGGLLWLQSWTWAAAALALVKNEKITEQQHSAAATQEVTA